MIHYQIKPYSNIAKIGLDRLEGTECSLNKKSDSPDGILIRSTKLTKKHIKDGLKAISRAGAGVNNIPIDLCTNKGIVVFNTPGANANAVKELVLAGLMLSSRNVYAGIDFVNGLSHLEKMKDLEPFLEENKKSFKGTELAGSTLGVVGLGAIGSKVASMGVALDMNVVGYDPALSVEAAWKLPSEVVPCASMEYLFGISDFISIHIPALDSTIGIINDELFKQANNLSLLNFKNISQADLELSNRVNCFLGDNGQGKTNLLDAIYHLSYTKSFFNSIDSQNVMFNESLYVIQGVVKNEQEEYKLYCGLKKGEKKIFKPLSFGTE